MTTAVAAAVAASIVGPASAVEGVGTPPRKGLPLKPSADLSPTGVSPPASEPDQEEDQEEEEQEQEQGQGQEQEQGQGQEHGQEEEGQLPGRQGGEHAGEREREEKNTTVKQLAAFFTEKGVVAEQQRLAEEVRELRGKLQLLERQKAEAEAKAASKEADLLSRLRQVESQAREEAGQGLAVKTAPGYHRAAEELLRKQLEVEKAQREAAEARVVQLEASIQGQLRQAMAVKAAASLAKRQGIEAELAAVQLLTEVQDLRGKLCKLEINHMELEEERARRQEAESRLIELQASVQSQLEEAQAALQAALTERQLAEAELATAKHGAAGSAGDSVPLNVMMMVMRQAAEVRQLRARVRFLERPRAAAAGAAAGGSGGTSGSRGSSVGAGLSELGAADRAAHLEHTAAQAERKLQDCLKQLQDNVKQLQQQLHPPLLSSEAAAAAAAEAAAAAGV